ncbi:MAG: HU family DNA-binding protein [Armatimonadota bacterium]
MTKAQLAAQVAARTGLTKKQASKVIDAVFSIITEMLTKKQNPEPINIVGFGKFMVRVRTKRTARKPKTGETVKGRVRRPSKQDWEKFIAHCIGITEDDPDVSIRHHRYFAKAATKDATAKKKRPR